MRLRTQTEEPAFRDALLAKRFVGKGLSRGNQFRLLVSDGGRVAGEAQGFVEDAPEAIQALIDDLNRTLNEPAAARDLRLADGYVRSELIEGEREKGLRDAGKVRLFPVTDFPPELQAVLTRVIDNPLDFHPLNRSQHERLLKSRSHGAEVFVVAGPGSSAFQLVLFSTK